MICSTLPLSLSYEEVSSDISWIEPADATMTSPHVYLLQMVLHSAAVGLRRINHDRRFQIIITLTVARNFRGVYEIKGKKIRTTFNILRELLVWN